MNTAKKLLANTVLLTLSTVIIRSVAMGFQVYISNLIGAEGIGIFELVMSIYGLAIVVGGSGVRVGSTCLIAEEFGYGRKHGVKKAVRQCLLYGLLVSVVVSVIVFHFAKPLGISWIGDERSVLPLKVSALCIPFSVMSSVMAGYFTASGKIGRYVVVEFFERSFSIVVTMFLLSLYGARGIPHSCACVVGGSGIGTVLSFFILFFMYRMDISGTDDTSHPMLKRLLNMTIPLAANEYIRSGLNTLEHMLIPKGLKSYGSQDAIASYGIIHGMVFPIITFPTAILYSVADILIPELSSCRAGNRPNRITYIVSHTMQMSFIFAALCTAILFATSDQLGILIYSSSEASLYFTRFAPLLVFIYLDTIVDGMLKGLGQQVYNVRLNTCTSILDILLLILLLPRFGIDGYITAFAVTKLINFGFSLSKIILVTGYRPRPSLIFKTLLAVAASIVFTGIIGSNASVVFCSITSALVFAAVIALTGAVTHQDINWLIKIINKHKFSEEKNAVINR